MTAYNRNFALIKLLGKLTDEELKDFFERESKSAISDIISAASPAVARWFSTMTKEELSNSLSSRPWILKEILSLCKVTTYYKLIKDHYLLIKGMVDNNLTYGPAIPLIQVGLYGLVSEKDLMDVVRYNKETLPFKVFYYLIVNCPSDPYIKIQNALYLLLLRNVRHLKKLPTDLLSKFSKTGHVSGFMLALETLAKSTDSMEELIRKKSYFPLELVENIEKEVLVQKLSSGVVSNETLVAIKKLKILCVFED